MQEAVLSLAYGFKTDLPGGINVGESSFKDKLIYLSYGVRALFGSAEAHYAMGILSLMGAGTKESFGKARNHFEKAEEKGYAYAAYNLGMLYFFANEKHPAIFYLEKAAFLGFPEGFLQAAEIHFAPSRDHNIVVELCIRGLELGAKGDIFDLIKYYFGDPDNFLRKASEEILDLMIKLGNTYCFGNKEVSVDRRRAFLLYSRLAPFYPPAKTQMAQCYLQGHGVQKDVNKCFQLLCELTADNQWGKSKSGGYALLGFCYLTGSGTTINGQKGRYWLQKAADYGSEEAYGLLGHSYRYGYGAETDFDKAILYYQRSADSNMDSNAATSAGELAEMYFEGIGCHEDAFRAYCYAEKAAKGNIAKGYHYLAACYFTAKGVKPDDKKALEYCKKALSLNPNDIVMQKMLNMLTNDGHPLRPVANLKKVFSDTAGNAIGEIAGSLFNAVFGTGNND